MNSINKTKNYKLEQETEFNVIRFEEQGNDIDNVIVEAMINGKFVKIYEQDEMGIRNGVVETIKTSEVKITVAIDEEKAPKYNVNFEKALPTATKVPFRVSSYIVVPFKENTEGLFDGRVKATTEAIIIGLYTWDENGNYITKQTEETIEKNINIVKNEFKKQNPSANIILEAGGFGGNKDFADKVFSTPEIRANFIKQTIDLLTKYNLSGVDIDYEYPDGENQWKNFDSLVIELKAALTPLGKILSLALPPWGVNLSKKAVESIDQLQVMIYDLFDEKRRHAPYAATLKAITYLKSIGFKTSQLNLGLSIYGREIDPLAKERWLSYAFVAEKFADIYTKDTNAMDGAYFTGVTMNNDKTLLTIENGCGGVMTFHYSCDLPFENELSIYRGISDTISKFIK